MKTSGKPVYRYLYARPRPAFLATPGQSAADTAAVQGRRGGGRGAQLPAGPRGASHSSEIQYAMGNLDLDKRYAWEPADYEVSKTMQAYFINFIKTGNPNGNGLPEWPAYEGKDGYQVMHLSGSNSHATADTLRGRYEFLDAQVGKGKR